MTSIERETGQQGDRTTRRGRHLLVSLAPLLLAFFVALGLRLLVWRWREFYPLGGDEQEYLNQALTLLREHRYVELRLMRPPLYTAFLAVSISLFDSLVQRLRLVQALISALTVVPVYLLTHRLFGNRRVALVAGLLAALSYTLAANATELLTETLFLFGLTTAFWLLVEAGGRWAVDAGGRRQGGKEARGRADGQFPHRAASRSPSLARSLLAGLAVGLLALLRSVALPLLPLGALWLAIRPVNGGEWTPDVSYRSLVGHRLSSTAHRFSSAAALLLAAMLVILPWTARNYARYGALIVVDTTGAENLWLDNDPAGREAVKAQLYALGDDRAARQRLAAQRGFAAIADNPGRFAAKAWGEAQAFFALQFFDELREKRAIWVAPLDVWLRLLLGDALWLALLIGGIVGLWCAPGAAGRRTTDGGRQTTQDETHRSHLNARPSPDPRWLFVPWALYILGTSLLFHVELRYRLPLYPALLPYAAWALTGRAARVRAGFPGASGPAGSFTARAGRVGGPSRLQVSGAALTVAGALALMLLHRPYPAEAAMLAPKHLALRQAEDALAAGDAARARAAATAALRRDPDSALARVALARAALLAGDRAAALADLGAAITALPAHPHAHLLRGAIWRAEGRAGDARRELAFERNSLEDLQAWAWDVFAPVGPPPRELAVGGGLDLGYLRGFSLAEGGYRWTPAQAAFRLAGAGSVLELELASGRPADAPRPEVAVLADGREIGRARPGPGWQTYRFPLPPGGASVVTLRSDTFRPRDYDRASPDGRALGVMVRRAAIT